jgi:hypothetical protein
MATFTPEFHKVTTGLIGAEGPVFTRDGRFFMVAPCKENEKHEADGEVVSVDLETGKVKDPCDDI